MANNLNGVALAAIAQESLAVLQPQVPMFSLFTTNFSDEVAGQFTSVTTRIPTAVTATAFTRSVGYVDQSASSSAVTTNLNNHYHVTFAFDDKEITTINLDILKDAYIPVGINGIVNQVQSNLFGLMTAGNFPQSSYSGSNASFNWSALLNAQKALDISGSTATRGALLNVPCSYALLNDIKANSTLGDSSAIRGGKVTQLAGLNIVQAPLVGSGFGLAGVVAAKDAIVLAARVPLLGNTNNLDSLQNVVASNGYTVQTRLWYSPDLGLTKMSFVSIFGSSVAQPASLTRIITVD